MAEVATGQECMFAIDNHEFRVHYAKRKDENTLHLQVETFEDTWRWQTEFGVPLRRRVYVARGRGSMEKLLKDGARREAETNAKPGAFRESSESFLGKVDKGRREMKHANGTSPEAGHENDLMFRRLESWENGRNVEIKACAGGEPLRRRICR